MIMTTPPAIVANVIDRSAAKLYGNQRRNEAMLYQAASAIGNARDVSFATAVDIVDSIAVIRDAVITTSAICEVVFNRPFATHAIRDARITNCEPNEETNGWELSPVYRAEVCGLLEMASTVLNDGNYRPEQFQAAVVLLESAARACHSWLAAVQD